jgi:Homeodomain-like domain
LFERKQEQLGHLVIWEPAKEEQAKQSHEALPTQLSEPLQPISVGPTLSPAHEAQRQLRRERRKQRYDAVIKLHEQGVSQVAIATLLGLDRDTVRHYIKAPSFPEIVRPKRGSLRGSLQAVSA